MANNNNDNFYIFLKCIIMEHLTDKDFWKNYWLKKKDIFKPISRKYIFSDIFENIVKQNDPKSAIEVGGFPGFYSIFLHKYFNLTTSLIDVVVIPSIMEKVCTINGVVSSEISYIEDDFFDYKPVHKFDLVFSNGFIEHFSDTEEVIKLHLQYLNEDGTLLIILPNFKSLNGCFQKLFDPQNYKKHFIQCMDKTYLRNICERIGLKNVEVFYYGYFSIWLEEETRKKIFPRLCRIVVHYPFKIIFRLLRCNTKFFAPYIVVKATL